MKMEEGSSRDVEIARFDFVDNAKSGEPVEELLRGLISEAKPMAMNILGQHVSWSLHQSNEGEVSRLME